MLKRDYEKFLLLLVALTVLLIPAAGFAADADYVIEDYRREITVHENNTYSVEDTMTVDWLTPAHGLRVDIPTRAEISAGNNGEVYNDTYQVVVSGVFADGQYDTKKRRRYLYNQARRSGHLFNGEAGV